MGGQQEDFVFRYQPGLGGEDLALIRYLKSFAPKRRKKMILMALRAFWEVDALKDAGSSPALVQRVGELNLDTIERRLEQLRQGLDCQASSTHPSSPAPNRHETPQSPSTYNYRSLGMELFSNHD
jgi:hypothetical protein